MTNNYQQTPYLRTQRQFPTDDVRQLSGQMDHAYIDIAQKVNARTIGVFPTNFPLVTGEQWYLNGQPKNQQTLRQVYTIAGLVAFNHGINMASVTTFTKITGVLYGSGNYYPLPYLDAVTSTNSIGVLVNNTQVLFTFTTPAVTITSGIIILEWLSQF